MNIEQKSIRYVDVKADWCQVGECPESQVKMSGPGEPPGALAEGWHHGKQACHPQGGPFIGHCPRVFLIDQCGHSLTGTLEGFLWK